MALRSGCGKLWGQINLKAFVQFVHYVPVATFHSVWTSVRWKACDISWRFLNSPWRYSLKPSLWSSLSFLHCSCTFKAQASLYSLLWHSAFIRVTRIWRRWSAKCNLDLERVDVEMNLFNRCHSNCGCFKAWQKARKTVEFFQVLLQIQILRDTQKVLVTLVTFLHTFTHPKVFTDISGLASLHGLLPWQCLGVSQDGRSKKDVIETKQQRSRCLWRKLVKGCCLIIPNS